MLAALSIRDIVLIDRLDLEFGAGLSVMTGETGAGKSILLDAFALALGARGDASLVRHGADRGQVTAVFAPQPGHPALGLLEESGIVCDDGVILRRTQSPDGRTKAFVNDQPVSAQLLRRIGEVLVEIHGQHDDRALTDAGTHRRLLDAYGGLTRQADEALLSRGMVLPGDNILLMAGPGALGKKHEVTNSVAVHAVGDPTTGYHGR